METTSEWQSNHIAARMTESEYDIMNIAIHTPLSISADDFIEDTTDRLRKNANREERNQNNDFHHPQDYSEEDEENLEYEEEDEEPELRHTLAVDLFAFETQYGSGRLYHRDFLLKVAHEKAELTTELAKPRAERKLKFLSHRTLKAWNAETALDEQDGDPQNVLVEFLTRVEFHPEFQRQCGHGVPRSEYCESTTPRRRHQANVGYRSSIFLRLFTGHLIPCIWIRTL
jgi:hypothetical protein